MKSVVFSFCMMVLFPGCSLKTIAPKEPFARAWEPILALLNTDASIKLDEQNAIGTNLVTHYQQELRECKATWDGADTTKLSHNERRVQENKWYAVCVAEQNHKLEKRLATYLNASPYNQDSQALSTRVLKQVEENSVAASSAVPEFDDGNQIGFCFGRALYAHYLLLKNGVAQQDLLKIFAVGDLFVNHQIWNFHMAIMIRDQKHGYLVVDPLQEKVLPYLEWMQATRKFSIKFPNSRIRFYVADPRKFMPAHGMYTVELLAHPVLKDYFSKLIQHM